MAIDPTAPIQLLPDHVDQVADTLYDALTQAESDREGFLSDVTAARVQIEAPDVDEDLLPFSTACPLNLKILKYIRNAFVSRISRGLLKSNPIHYVSGRGEAERANEQFVEKFLYEQEMRQLDLERTYRPVLVNTIDDGTGACFTRWEPRYRRKLYYEQTETAEIDPETGEVLSAKNSIKRVYKNDLVYDGPAIYSLPLENVGVFPASSSNLQLAQGAFVKLSYTGNDLQMGVDDGSYDEEAVNELRLNPWGEVENAKREYLETRNIGLSAASYLPGEQWQMMPFDIVEWYWLLIDPRYPKEIAGDWLITMDQSTRTILRAGPSPFGHGMRPITLSHIYPPKFGIYGEGVAEIGGNTQAIISSLVRAVVNGTNLRVDPMIAVGTGITEDDLEKWMAKRGPGEYQRFAVDDITKALTPIVLGMNPNDALATIQMLSTLLERQLQYNNAMGGQEASRQTTATEIERMIQGGQEGIIDMIDNASHGLSDLGELLMAMDYEHAGNASVQELWALANPEAMGADLTEVLGGHYDIRASGTTQTTDRALRKQRAIEKYTAMREDAFVNIDPTGKRIYTLTKEFLVDGFEDRQPEQLIGKESEAALIPAAQQAAQLMQVIQQAGLLGPDGQPMAPGGQDAGDGGMEGEQVQPTLPSDFIGARLGGM